MGSQEELEIIIKARNLTDDAFRKLQDNMKGTEAASKALARAGKDWTDFQKSIKSITADLSGGKASKEAQILAHAVASMGGPAKLSAVGLEKLNGEIKRLAADGAKLPATLKQITQGFEQMNAVASKSKSGGELFKTEALAQANAQLAGITGKLGPLGSAIGAVGPQAMLATGAIVGVGAAAIGTAKAMGDLMMASAAWGAKITDTSTTLGMTVEAVQKLEYAAIASGSSFDKAAGAVLNMQRVLINTPDKIADLGVELEKFKGLAPEEQLKEVASALSAIEDPAERNAAAVSVLGKSWGELAPLLSGGLAAMEDVNGMSAEQVAKLNELQTQLNLLSFEWNKMWVEVGGGLVESTGAVEVLRGITDGVRGFAEIVRGFPLDTFMLIVRGLAASMTVGASELWIAGGQQLLEVGQAARERAADQSRTGAAEEAGMTAPQLQIKRMEEEANKKRERDKRLREQRAAEDKKLREALAREGAERTREILERRDVEDSLANARGDTPFGIGLISDPDQIAENERRRQASLTMMINPKGAAAMQQLTNMLPSGGNQFTTAIPIFDEINHKTKLNIGSMQDWAAATQSLQAAFEMLGIDAGGALSQVSALLTQGGQFAAAMASGNVAGMVSGGIGTATSLFETGRKGGLVGTAASVVSPIALAGNLFGGDGPQQGKAMDVANVGIQAATANIDNLIDSLNEGRMSLADFRRDFEGAFNDVVQNGISRTTGLLHESAREMLAFAQASGVESDAMLAFLGQQSKNVVTGLGSALGGMKGSRDTAAGDAGRSAERRVRNQLEGRDDLSPEEVEERVRRAGNAAADEAAAAVGIVSQRAATALSASVATQFDNLVQSGLSRQEAMQEVAPLIESMRTELEAAGFTGAQAFLSLNEQLNLMNGEITGPLLSGVTSYTEALVGMHNMNQLNNETLAGFTEQVGANISAMQEQGVQGPALLGALAPDLQRIWEMQQKYGGAIDATTQSMINEAIAAGMVGEEHKSAQDKMADASIRTANAVERIAAALTGLGPAAEEGVNGINRAFEKVQPPDIGGPPAPPAGTTGGTGGTKVPRGHATGGIFGGPIYVKGFASGTIGKAGGGIVKDTTPVMVGKDLSVIGEGGPEVVAPVSSLFGSVGKHMQEESGLNDAVEALQEATSALQAAAAAIVAGKDSGPAQNFDITVQNAPQITVRDESVIKTREGVEAFQQQTLATLERALRLNTNGLGSRLRQLIREEINQNG
jgi:hypothetical protein